MRAFIPTPKQLNDTLQAELNRLELSRLNHIERCVNHISSCLIGAAATANTTCEVRVSKDIWEQIKDRFSMYKVNCESVGVDVVLLTFVDIHKGR